MTRPTRGPQVGRPRAALLVALAAASVVDLGAFVGIVAGDDQEPAPAAGPGPDEVAVAVVRAVAAADCDDLAPLLGPTADLPFAVTSCLDGEAVPVPVDEVTAGEPEVEGDRATVRVALVADGVTSELDASLRRTGEGDGRDDGWRLDGLAPVS